MKIPEKYYSIAEYCGKSEEMKLVEEKLEIITTGKEKNIVVLGENNSGKTTLINRICGMEVKKPTPIISEPTPMMVATSTGKVKKGYEFIHIDNEILADKEITLYELPSCEIENHMLEMDMAIYSISATMPFTATDIANLDVFSGYVPTVIVINRLDVIENEEDKKESVDYVEDIVRKKFKGRVVKVVRGDVENLVDEVLTVLDNIDIQSGREFRSQQIICRFKEGMINTLNDMLTKSNEKLNERTSAQKASEDIAEEERLQWNSIRVDMLSKEQETRDKINLLINKSKMNFINDMILQYETAPNKEKWLNEVLSKNVNSKLCKVKQSVISTFKPQFELHVAWLVNEANEKLGYDIKANDFAVSTIYDSMTDGPNIEKNKTGRGVAIATGAAAIAVAAIIAPITTLPTCIISIPALAVSAYMLGDHLKQNKEDDERIKAEITKYIESSYAIFTKRVHDALKTSYQNIISYIVSCKDNIEAVSVISDDIIEKQSEINEKINELMN